MWLWRKRNLYILMSVISLQASALTLGDFDVKTRASENFQGEIELYNVYETDYRKIEVKISPRESSVDESPGSVVWENVGFGVSLSNGLAWVTVYSGKPLRVETDIVVQVSWPGGQVERMYSISPIGVEKPFKKTPCRASGSFIYCR